MAQSEREGRVLAEEVVRRGVGHLDGAVLHAVDARRTAGISSPPACTVIWNLPPVISLTFLANTSAAPKMVSSDFGKLDARRQRMLACACTMAGAAPAASTPARPAPSDEGTTFHERISCG